MAKTDRFDKSSIDNTNCVTESSKKIIHHIKLLEFSSEYRIVEKCRRKLASVTLPLSVISQGASFL